MMQGGKGRTPRFLRNPLCQLAPSGMAPIPLRPGPPPFVMTSAAVGSDEQIFGVNEQILGQDQSDQLVPVRPTNYVGSLLQRRRCALSHLGGGR